MNTTAIRLFAILSAFFCLAQAHGQPSQSVNPEAPSLSGKIQEVQVRVGDRERSYATYLPAGLAPGRALVIVLHGTNMTGQRMRRATGWIFEALADRHGFAVAYPDAHQGSWHDCRKDVSSSARFTNVDDVGFLRALIRSFASELKIDPRKVYLFGFSGGGHMAYRMAFEAPSEIAAVAAVAANLPPPESLSCANDGTTPRVMLVNGTADQINPHEGGAHQAGGSVISSRATAVTFARRNNLSDPPTAKVIQSSSKEDPPSVQLLAWYRGGQPIVALYSVDGGGHAIPQPVFRFPDHLGVTGQFDSPSAAWAFFSTQP